MRSLGRLDLPAWAAIFPASAPRDPATPATRTMPLPSTPTEVARAVAERLCSGLAEEPFAIPGQTDGLPVTASIGVATTTDPTETVEGLLMRADAALYAAKEGGRNQVRAADGANSPGANRRSQGTVKSA